MTRTPALLLVLALAACRADRTDDGTDLGTGDAVKGGAQVTVGTPGAGTATTDDPTAEDVARGMADGDRETAAGDVVMEGTTLVGDVDRVANHRGALTSMAPGVAVPLIRRIAERLHATDDDQLHDIAGGLDDLRKQLEQEDADGREIGETLRKLSEQVAQYANSNTREAQSVRPRLARISGALSAAAKSLAGSEGERTGAGGTTRGRGQ